MDKEKTTYQQKLDERLRKWVTTNRTRISLIIVGFVVGHILLYLYFVFVAGREYAAQNLFQIISGVFLVDLILGISSYVYIAYHKISEEIYNDQELKIRKLQEDVQLLKDKWESYAVPLKLTVTALNNKSEQKQIVSLKIENPIPNKVSNLKIELKDLIYNPFLSNEAPHSVLDEISYSNRAFKDIDGLNKDGGIDGLDFVIVHLGKIVENNLVLLLKNNITNHSYWEYNEDEENIEKIKKIQPEYIGWKSYNCRYDIDLIIRGEIDGHPLEAQSFTARIEFREMIRHWVEINRQWVKTGDFADIYTRIDIYEVKYSKENQETTSN